MIDTERINSQLSLSHGKVIASVGPGSTVNVERINNQLALLQEKVIASVDGGEGHPLRHSVRSTGWPLVLIIYQNKRFLNYVRICISELCCFIVCMKSKIIHYYAVTLSIDSI